MIRLTQRLLMAACVVAAFGPTARAGLIPVEVTVNPENNGNFQWTYSVVLPTGNQLQAGSQFTVYDFGGFVPGSATVTSAGPSANYASDWQFSSANLGPIPAHLNPQDDPSIANLTWTYEGPTINTGGQITLGNFTAISTSGQSSSSFFTATNTIASDGVTDSNITTTTVPLGSGSVAAAPEPATLALAGLGLPLLGAARLVRRKKS